MRIGSIEIKADLYKVIDKLRRQLKLSNSPYLSKEPKTSGDYLMVQCPYHKNGQENHPSAQFRLSDGLFYCHNCKKSHKLVDVIKHCTGEDGRDWLINNFNAVDIEDREVSFDFIKQEDNLPVKYISSEEYQKYRRIHPYMYTRKLTDEIIKKFDIGYDENYILDIKDEHGKVQSRKSVGECITFPNKDEYGHILFIARRAINIKFFHYPENVDKPVYGLYEIYREIQNGKDIKEIYVCESMLDALFIWVCGKYAVALNGTGSATQYEILRKADFRVYILAFDNDKAGQFARTKFKENVKNKIIKEVDYESYGSCKDINDMTEEQFLNANIIGGLFNQNLFTKKLS